MAAETSAGGVDAAMAALQVKIKAKDSMELRIRTLMGTLGAVGMHEALVDDEGFPRDDVDIAAIREARQEVIRLQNDHKGVMGEIEAGIHALHAGFSPTDVPRGPAKVHAAAPLPVPVPATGAGGAAAAGGRAIAVVTEVTEGGPAAAAGFQVGDQLLSVGSAGGEGASLTSIATVVRGSIGAALPVTALRGEEEVSLALVPASWAGPGVLGMRIAPPA